MEALDMKRVGRGMRRTKWDLSLACFIFYFLLISVSINTTLFALRIGPYKPRYTIYAKEAESIHSKTKRSFEIYVHPVARDKYVSMALQIHGTWETDLHKRLLRVMRGYKDAALLDLGAHLGFHSLAAASEGHKVVAVEPVAANAAQLRKSVAANGLQGSVEVVQAAALDAPSPKVCMHSSRANSAHSFVRPRAAPALPRTTRVMKAVGLGVDVAAWATGIGKHFPDRKVRRDRVQDYHKEHHDSDDCEDVEGVEIGERLRGRGDVLAVKADVEGSEMRALQGLLPHMRESPPCYIFVDFHPEMLHMQDSGELELVQLVHRYGYEVYTLGKETHIHPDLHELFAMGGVVKKDTKYKGKLHGKFPEEPRGDMILLELQHKDLDKCLSRFEYKKPAEGEEDEDGEELGGTDRPGASPENWVDPIKHRQEYFDSMVELGKEHLRNASATE